MESAIDKHLKCPRTQSRRMPCEHKPLFPMFVARADESLRQVVMVYLGVQFDEQQRGLALNAMRHIVARFSLVEGPASHDMTYHVDAQGYGNFIIVGYWRDPALYHRWLRSPPIDDWWKSDERLQEGLGYFREIIAPQAEQFETLYNFKNNLPGVGATMDGISGEVEDHGYWGSACDRFPLSQTDKMEPTNELQVISANNGRVLIRGHNNLTLIRSGQDWSEAGEKERALFFNEMLPSLQSGMNFLRDHGQALGCYSNRFVRNIDLEGHLLDITYNIGHWRSLEKLEQWAESHPTHQRIFATFFNVAADLSTLHLYHEVSVSDGHQQFFEYINCHPQTGMMRDSRPI